MPYITESRRSELSESYGDIPETSGELNYQITQLLISYWGNNGKTGYQYINDIIGALEGAKLEFYRRVAIPYENQKIKENGDVYV